MEEEGEMEPNYLLDALCRIDRIGGDLRWRLKRLATERVAGQGRPLVTVEDVEAVECAAIDQMVHAARGTVAPASSEPGSAVGHKAVVLAHLDGLEFAATMGREAAPHARLDEVRRLVEWHWPDKLEPSAASPPEPAGVTSAELAVERLGRAMLAARGMRTAEAVAHIRAVRRWLRGRAEARVGRWIEAEAGRAGPTRPEYSAGHVYKRIGDIMERLDETLSRNKPRTAGADAYRSLAALRGDLRLSTR